jgi:NitT/TauT family transport system permease protein
VGVRLLNENKYLHLAPVLAIQITILLVGLVQDRLLAGLKKVVSPYASLRTERK